MAEGDGDAWRWFKELRAEVLEAQKIRAQIVRAQGHLPELVAITTDGAYTDHAHVDAAVKAVFTEMTELLEAEGATLAVSELLRLPALPAE